MNVHFAEPRHQIWLKDQQIILYCYDCIRKGYREHCNFCNQVIGLELRGCA